MLSWSRKSISRDILENKLKGLTDLGNLLDIGGGKSYGYESMVKAKSIYSINIDPKAGSTKIVDIEQKLPIKSESYDTVLCFNVLEHIYNYDNVISESNRVLRENGKILIFVPFMHHLHAHPHDLNRFSSEKLKRLLLENGFENIIVEPKVYGIFSLLFQTTIHWWVMPIRPIIKYIVVVLDIIFNKLPFYRRVSENIPLAYFVIAQRKTR